MCVVAESLYVALLFAGGALMTLELFPCFGVMNKLKLSAFAAMCTALSGKRPRPLAPPGRPWPWNQAGADLGDRGCRFL